ncbi:DUF362 domain-containing protein [Candidatus Bathyarchaeota archaeon]|nr:DUF362 domain-containing protein [Candidatus Bathyarchaeota archaeon]
MAKNRVAITKHADTSESVRNALDLIRNPIKVALQEKFKNASRGQVLIKPNLLSTDLNHICNTTVEHCKAIADFFYDLGDYTVVVGEGTTYASDKNPSTILALERHGFKEHEDQWALIDLHEDQPGKWFDIINHEAPRGIELGIAKTCIESFTVSAAKFKTHDVLGVTLGLKNMMGGLVSARNKVSQEILARGDVKGYMHGFSRKKPHFLSREINTGASKVALAVNLVRMHACHPPDLTVIDGSTIMEGAGPRRGTACQALSGITIAGTDTIAVDAACARMIGMPLESFKYIQRAGELGLGDHEHEKTILVGESLDGMITRIKFHPQFKLARKWTTDELKALESFTRFPPESHVL